MFDKFMPKIHFRAKFSGFQMHLVNTGRPLALPDSATAWSHLSV